MKKRILLGVCTCVLVCVGFVLSNASSSMITVSGHVWDQDNQPLHNATVQVNQSSDYRTTTSPSGSFSLTCPKGSTVIYSYSDDSGDEFESESRTYNSNNLSESITLRYKDSSSSQN